MTSRRMLTAVLSAAVIVLVGTGFSTANAQNSPMAVVFAEIQNIRAGIEKIFGILPPAPGPVRLITPAVRARSTDLTTCFLVNAGETPVDLRATLVQLNGEV